jgi:hypothetical protein
MILRLRSMTPTERLRVVFAANARAREMDGLAKERLEAARRRSGS